MNSVELYALWVALPLLPAALVFLIFPHTALGTAGPLRSLTVNAAGAFVAYFTVFVVLGYPLLHLMVDRVDDGEAQRETAAAPKATPAPTSVDALVKLASSYSGNGDYDRAIAYYSKAVAIDPKSPSIFNNRGVNYEAAGNYDQAIMDYNQAISLDSNYALAYSNRCSARFKEKEYASAVKDCDRGVQLDPTFANAYILRADALRAMDKLDDAIRDYGRAIELDPKSIPAIFHQARVYEQAGRIDDALKNYSKIIQLDPRKTVAYNNRCWARATKSSAKSELDEALSDCNKALELQPTYTSALDSRGLVLLKLCKFDDAVKDYDSALRFRPHQASSLYGRGIAKLKSGDEKGGQEDLAEAKANQDDVAKEFESYGVDRCPL